VYFVQSEFGERAIYGTNPRRSLSNVSSSDSKRAIWYTSADGYKIIPDRNGMIYFILEVSILYILAYSSVYEGHII
jgi:hypothetical protein